MQSNSRNEENEVESSAEQNQQVEQSREGGLTTTNLSQKIKSEITDPHQNSPEISNSSYQLYPSPSTSVYPHNGHSHPLFPPSPSYSSTPLNHHFHHDRTTGSIPLSANRTSNANSSTVSCGNNLTVDAVSSPVATTTTTTLTFTQSQASFVASLQAATTTVPFHNPNPTNPTNLNPNLTNPSNPNPSFGSSYPQFLSHLPSSTGTAQMLVGSTNFCAAPHNSRGYLPATSLANAYLHPETTVRPTDPMGTIGAAYTHAQAMVGTDTNLSAVLPSASFSTPLESSRGGYNGSGPMHYANEMTKLHGYPSADTRIGISPLSVYSHSTQQFLEHNRTISSSEAKRQRYSSAMSDGFNSSPTTTTEIGSDLPRSHSVAAPSTSHSTSNQIPSQSPQPSTATYHTAARNIDHEKQLTYRNDASLSEDRRRYSSDQHQTSSLTRTANELSQQTPSSPVTSSSTASSEFASSGTTQFQDSMNTTIVSQPLQYVAYFPANVSLPITEPFAGVAQHTSGIFVPPAPSLRSGASAHPTSAVFEAATSFVPSNLEQILVAANDAEKIPNSDPNDAPSLSRAKNERLISFDNEKNGDKILPAEPSTSQPSVITSFSNEKRVTNIITQSEADAMDVSALNEMLGVVAPKNRGNSHLKREWRNVGWFTNEAEMNVVRKQQKVSKWKSVDQISGLKVFFRCNKWKRTNCNYRMFVMYYAMDRISLNESGQHDHSVVYANKSKKKPTSALNQPQSQDTQQGEQLQQQQQQQSPAARAVFEATPSSSQQSVLDQLIRNATANATSSSFDTESVFDTVNSGVDSICGLKSTTPSQSIADYEENGTEGSYHLSDGQNIAELLQVAADMDLTFTFNSRRTCEYCFESNTPQMKGRMIVFSDLGDKVGVAERFNGVERGSEQWRKADWKQFLWAVRGKCMNALKGV